MAAVSANNKLVSMSSQRRMTRDSMAHRVFAGVNTCDAARPTLYTCQPDNAKFKQPCSCSGPWVVSSYKDYENLYGPTSNPMITGWQRMTDKDLSTYKLNNANCWACKGFTDGLVHTAGSYYIGVQNGNLFLARLESHYDNHPAGYSGPASYHPGFSLYMPSNIKFRKVPADSCTALNADKTAKPSSLVNRSDCGQFPAALTGSPNIKMVAPNTYQANVPAAWLKTKLPTSKTQT